MFKANKYGSYAEKKKRNKALKVGAIIIGTTVCVAGIYQFVILDFYGQRVRENTIAELTNDDSGFVQTYVLNADIPQGTLIDETLLTQVTQSKSTVPTTCITDISKVKDLSSRISLSQNTVLTFDMLTDMEEVITDDVKNQDFNWIRIHAFMDLGNYVDIHYKELDGTDTIVAAKKNVTNLSGNVFSCNITELERSYINNATVRAAVTGGELYLSIYPEPENQNPAEVTYVVDRKIQQEIEKDPNIVNRSVKTLSDNNEKGVEVDTYINNDKPSFAGGNN